MATEVKIKEIFESIQGEGPFVGVNQLFIRFCGCNLNCEYCDTDFMAKDAESYTTQSLVQKIKTEYDLNKIHSISLTGGEPLLNADFINKFITELHTCHSEQSNKSPKKIFRTKSVPIFLSEGANLIYLETNATLTSELLKVKDKIDIISADIKLPSSTGKDTFALHDEFLNNCNGIYTFAKIVFDQNINSGEICTCADLGKKYGIELILQPKMNGKKMGIDNDFCQNIFNKFLKLYPNIRLIPQVHKFLNIR